MDTLDAKQQTTIQTTAGEFVVKRLTAKERRYARTVLASQLRNGVPVEQVDGEMIFLTNSVATLQVATVKAPDGFNWDNADDFLIYELIGKFNVWEQSFRQ